MSELTKEEIEKINRIETLEQEALSAFANKMDFNISDWLDAKDFNEYGKLKKEIDGECITCGEETCKHFE